MEEFSATLLREKFILEGIEQKADRKEIATGNRLILPLISPNGNVREEYIIRSQNMHTAVRYASLMAKEFYRTGPMMSRKDNVDWQDMFKQVMRGYEEKWNPGYWICVYHKGQIIFEDGIVKRPALLDIIEKCDAQNPNDYDHSVKLAKDAFQQVGSEYNIKHDSNIAMLINVTEQVGKCAAVVRGPNRKTTFNFTARRTEDHKVQVAQCLNISAAFLEGIQVAFSAGMIREKLRLGLIDKFSSDAKKGEDAGALLGRLNLVINQFENLLDVHYRPERPEFSHMIDEASAYMNRLHQQDLNAQKEAEQQAEEEATAADGDGGPDVPEEILQEAEKAAQDAGADMEADATKDDGVSGTDDKKS